MAGLSDDGPADLRSRLFRDRVPATPTVMCFDDVREKRLPV